MRVIRNFFAEDEQGNGVFVMVGDSILEISEHSENEMAFKIHFPHTNTTEWLHVDNRKWKEATSD